MKKIIMLLGFILVLTTEANCQISQTIECNETKYGKPAHGGTRRFTGVFNFENIPKPLERARVSFTLNVVDENLPYLQDDWLIKVDYTDNSISLISDSLFLWPGPHKAGDNYSGSIEFIPLMSGPWQITLYLVQFIQRGIGTNSKSGISFQWCFDPDGNLEYLGKPINLSDCLDKGLVFFFDKDSLFFPQYFGPYKHGLFTCEVTIKPIPKIGDTSIAYYKLTALKDIPGGCDMSIEGTGMEFTKIPLKIDYPIFKGQSIELQVGFTPKPVRARHHLKLALSSGESKEERRDNLQHIHYTFIFHNDGSLRYAGASVGLDLISDDYLPKNFRQAPNKRDVTTIYIKADSEDEVIER